MNRIINKYAILTLAILIFSINIPAQTQDEIFIVADQKKPCGFTGKTDCLQIKRLSEERFSNFFGEIENFRYIPGYFYVLEVRVSGTKNSPQTRYRLRKVLARVKSETKQNEADFYGTRWKLVRIKGENINNDRAFITFNEDKKSAGGNGGCNGFGGNLMKNGTQIKISEIISTKMFCENGSDVENKYFAALDDVTEYEIKGQRLFLKARKAVILEFEAK